MKLTAGDIKGLGNTSLTDLLAKYQSQYDTVQKNILNLDYAYLLNVLKIDSANYKNLLIKPKQMQNTELSI